MALWIAGNALAVGVDEVVQGENAGGQVGVAEALDESGQGFFFQVGEVGGGRSSPW